jgi:hypothetical protein
MGYCVLRLLLSLAMCHDTYSHIYTCWVSFDGVNRVTWELVGIFSGWAMIHRMSVR